MVQAWGLDGRWAEVKHRNGTDVQKKSWDQKKSFVRKPRREIYWLVISRSCINYRICVGCNDMSHVTGHESDLRKIYSSGKNSEGFKLYCFNDCLFRYFTTVYQLQWSSNVKCHVRMIRFCDLGEKWSWPILNTTLETGSRSMNLTAVIYKSHSFSSKYSIYPMVLCSGTALTVLILILIYRCKITQ
jgi:hypothetical protein